MGILSKVAAFGLAAAAIMAPGAHAYQPSDVCSVEISLKYTQPSVFTQTFTIANGQDSSQDATGSMSLQPGTFTVETKGLLCAEHGGGTAYIGESTEQVIDGSEDANIALSIMALDQEVYGSTDQNTDYAPVVVSVSVSPNHHVKYGDDVQITVGAIDPIDGVNPGGYALTTPDGTPGGTFDTQTCTAGTACTITYTAGDPDNGNIRWAMEVSDATSSLKDNVEGYFVVDPTSGVDFTVANYHAPAFAATENLAPANGQVAYGTGNQATFDVVVQDIDISKLGDSVTLAIKSVTEVATVIQQGSAQQTIACDVSDLTGWDTALAHSTDHTKFTLTYDPWNNANNNGHNAAHWGETWCEFEFEATDSQGLSGHTMTFTVSAIGEPNTNSAFGQVPYFQQVFVSDSSPSTGDTLTLSVTYTDPDSNTKLTITPDASFSDTAPIIVDDNDCTAAACVEAYELNIIAEGSYTVVLLLEDMDDPALTQTKTLSFVAPSRRSRRGSGNACDSQTFNTQITMGDGEVHASADCMGTEGSSNGGAADGAADGATAGASGTGMVLAAAGTAALVALVVGTAVGAKLAGRRAANNAHPNRRPSAQIDLEGNNQQPGIDL